MVNGRVDEKLKKVHNMYSERKIIRNSARCRNCGDHLISTHRHDYKTCICHARSTVLLEKFRIGNEPSLPWDNPELKRVFAEECHGIMVDGGNVYIRRGWYNKADLEDTSIYEEDDKKDKKETE